jgi:hypothetical protein
MSVIDVPVFGLVGPFLDQRVLPIQLGIERALSLPLGQGVYAVARAR